MVGRVFLLVLGLVLLVWGAGTPLIGLFGAEARGVVVDIRRQQGDRAEAIPNRYAYAVTYAFTVADGRRIEATSQRIGDFFSPAMARDGHVDVRYLPAMPFLSVDDWGIGAFVENLIVAAVGLMLLRIALRPVSPRRSRHRVDRNRRA